MNIKMWLNRRRFRINIRFRNLPFIEKIRLLFLWLLLDILLVYIVVGMMLNLLGTRSVSISNEAYSDYLPENGIDLAAEDVHMDGQKGDSDNPPIFVDSIQGYVCKKFGKDCPIAIAIMKAESQGDPTRIGDTHLMFEHKNETLGHSIGLFQIRTGGNEGGKGWSRPEKHGISVREFEKKMLNAHNNIDYAYDIYKKSGWNPWSSYKTGVYKKYMPPVDNMQKTAAINLAASS